MKNSCKISWGLFLGKPSLAWIKDIKIYIERIFFILKHTYPPYARWETFSWFTDVMKEILTWYRNHRMGSPVVIDNYFDNPDCDADNEAAWNHIIDTMMECLNKMDESNSIYDDMEWKEKDEKMFAAKDEFFKLFSQYFYNLWD